MNTIIPAVLPRTYEDLELALGRMIGAASLVQIDLCDGVFVDNRTWPLNPEDRGHFASIVRGDEGLPYWSEFNFEIDLMVHNPENYITSWISAGITHAVIHLESRHNWDELKLATGGSVELGIAIDLDPPYEKLESYVPRVDYVQIMGIAKLGKQGSVLDERVYPLIKRVRADFPDVTIQIDGGVTMDNARMLLDCGADRLVVGSKIVDAAMPKDAIKDFQNV
jgi:ribulose-phosphate 3-epimerase